MIPLEIMSAFGQTSIVPLAARGHKVCSPAFRIFLAVAIRTPSSHHTGVVGFEDVDDFAFHI